MAKLLPGEASRGLGNFSILPYELVIYIISLLPFKDAVRTSILSTRWRYLYASISILHFNFKEDGDRRNLTGFQNVVDKLFDLRSSSSRCLVDKFSLSDSVSRDLNPLSIQRWTQSVTWHGVREFDIIIARPVMVPSSLCTCKTLEVLKLKMPKRSFEVHNYPLFEVPAKVSLPSLKVLHLVNVAYADDKCVDRLISNCPVLQKFEILLWDDDCKLSVISTTVKYLNIQYWCSKGWSGDFDIVINAPNVDFLRYSVSAGVTSQTFAFGSALTEVAYSLRRHGDHSHYLRNATHFLRTIKNIKTLRTNDYVIKNFQEFNIPLPIFKNLTRLRVICCGYGFKGLPYLLACCESLELMEFIGDFVWNSDPDDWIPLEELRVNCLMSHLKFIDIAAFKPEKDQIEAVKYFLKSARVLKQIKIQLCREVDGNSEIIKKLTMLPRISDGCKVGIVQNGRVVCVS